MAINPFKLERFFAQFEFTAPHLLSCSDCEALTLDELLSYCDEPTRLMWYELKLGYTDSQGHPLLRDEVAKLYSNIQLHQVLVVTPEEGIYITMQSLLQKGDHIVVTFPGYQSLYEVANSNGCKVTRWEPIEKNGWHFDVERLRSLVTNRTKMIVINFPHNPTGATISESELNEIVEIARKKNIILFSDEMYRFLEHDSANRISSVCENYENAISLFGMSKSFALAGLRIGWLTTRNAKLLDKIATYKDYTTICNSAPSEILALMALRAKDRILSRNLAIINSNLKILDSFFDKYQSLFQWYKPKAGPIAFPRLKIDMEITKFCSDLVDKKGVMLLPASVYDFTGNYFRIGYARNSMPEALGRLEEYIEDIRFSG